MKNINSNKDYYVNNDIIAPTALITNLSGTLAVLSVLRTFLASAALRTGTLMAEGSIFHRSKFYKSKSSCNSVPNIVQCSYSLCACPF